MSSNIFPEVRAKELIHEMKNNVPCYELVKIYYTFLKSLLQKSNYARYGRDLQEDMVSWAVWEWLKYGHKYDETKGKVFSFWTRNAENSFKLVLKKHYRHVNIERLIVETIEARSDLLMVGIDTEED